MKIKKYFLSFMVVVLCLVPFLAFGFTETELGSLELETVRAEAKYGTASLPQVIGRVVTIVLSLMALIAIVIIIVAGFQWMTSGGSEDKIKAAKKLMGSAMVGLIIIIFAYAVAKFIIDKLVVVTA